VQSTGVPVSTTVIVLTLADDDGRIRLKIAGNWQLLPVKATKSSRPDVGAVVRSAASDRMRTDDVAHRPTGSFSDDPVISGLREAFARAIAYRDDLPVGLIGTDNTVSGWVTTAEAVRTSRAFFVDIDLDILAIDCDEPSKAETVYEIADELRAAGERPVLLESGQLGRLHLFCRVRDGALHERLRQRARELGLDVRQAIRPPLSPHRLGLAPRLISPADPKEALSALQPPYPRRRRDLSPRMQELLEGGHVRGAYRSRSEPIMALALAAVNARWTFNEFLTAIAALRVPSSTTVLTRIESFAGSGPRPSGSSAFHPRSPRGTTTSAKCEQSVYLQIAPLGLAEQGLRTRRCWRRTSRSLNAPAPFSTAPRSGRLPTSRALRHALDEANGITNARSAAVVHRAEMESTIARASTTTGRVLGVWLRRSAALV
jgi:hypothetical protein